MASPGIKQTCRPHANHATETASDTGSASAAAGPVSKPSRRSAARMLPTPVVAAAATEGAGRLPVNRLSHARLSWPDRPPEGRWRVPGGMGLRPTLPPAPPARNGRLRDSQQQWPPLACHPGTADDGHLVDRCTPKL